MNLDYVYVVILGLLIVALIGDLIRVYLKQKTYTVQFQEFTPKWIRFTAMCVLLGLCWWLFGGLQGFVPALCWVLVGHLAGF